jgi:ATP-dependent RNA helicase DHX29
MAKKKKTTLKPVARGFATTSVPKKVVEAVEDIAQEEQASTDVGVSEVEEGNVEAAAQPAKAAEAEEWDPEKVEEQSLQNLIDKLQEKTEKEVVRTVKVNLLS